MYASPPGCCIFQRSAFGPPRASNARGCRRSVTEDWKGASGRSIRKVFCYAEEPLTGERPYTWASFHVGDVGALPVPGDEGWPTTIETPEAAGAMVPASPVVRVASR